MNRLLTARYALVLWPFPQGIGCIALNAVAEAVEKRGAVVLAREDDILEEPIDAEDGA